MTDFGGPYFKLPRSAIDTVQSGTLPYGEIFLKNKNKKKQKKYWVGYFLSVDILHMIIGRGTNDTVSSANVVHSVSPFVA